MSEQYDLEEKLPRRDWLLLPLVVLLVTGAFLGVSECAARVMFAERGQFTCAAERADGVGLQKPNCVAHLKNAEGPEVEYRFNECGYRSSKPCGPKPPNTLRVVLIGTSITMGLYVPADETFAVRTENALNRVCRRPVEVQNMGALVDLPAQPALAAKALDLSPDVIVLTVVPFDIQEPFSARQQSEAGGIATAAALWEQLKLRARATRLMLAAAHFMLSDEQMLYQSYLSSGASRDIMAFPPVASGERRYLEFGRILDRTLKEISGAGVPLVVMAVPNRIAAAMVSNHSRVEGTDALWFGRHIGEIAVQHGALSLDATPEFAKSPGAERLFYPVDNHPTGGAHKIISEALVNRLTDGSIPAMDACRTPQGNR